MVSLKSNTGRKTIAVLGAQLNRVWGGEFISGVLDAAEQNDVNVVCFIGGKPFAIDSHDGKISFGLYDLIKTQQFDGLLLSADLAHGLSAEEMRSFIGSLASIPMASFAIPSEDVSTFITDSEVGMRAIIRHLIEVHGYQKIAFIRGLRGQLESEQRLRAYKDELKAHNIPFDENMVADGDFSPESGRAAVRTLLDERRLQIQAIAASNDRMAFGAMEALQQRGIHVPDSVALTGFDDVPESQSVAVPLTTVHQSFYEVGRQALIGLLKKMNGAKIDNITLLSSSFVIRWSCGCLPESIKKSVVLSKEVAQTGRLGSKRDAAVQALLSAIGISESVDYKKLQDVFGRTWDVFLASLGESDKSDAFLKMIQASIETMQQYGLEFSVWHNMLSTFRKYALAGIENVTARLQAENLFQQARMLAGELSQRTQAYHRMTLQQQEETLSGFSFSMAPAMTFDEIGQAISKHFPTLGISRWYVMFYADIASSSALSFATDNYRLLMQYENDTFTLPREKTVMTDGKLVPNVPTDRRYSAIVMPLSLATSQFGFMWAEIGPKDWDVYVRIKNLLSSALLRTMLAEQREQAQREVQRLFEAEQARRQGAEALARTSRQLSSLKTAEKLPQQIVDQLQQVLPFDRGILLMEDVHGAVSVSSQLGMPPDAPLSSLRFKMKGTDFYESILRKGEALVVNHVVDSADWVQPDWLPRDRSWLGVPIYSINRIIGLIVISRHDGIFTQDDGLLVTTYVAQASIALENARLYEEVTGMNQVMERMVAQRVEELNVAYSTLEKHDKNKSAFIQVAAHELRTPLTVIKGYLGMLKADASIQANSMLDQAVDGVLQGTNRLHQIVTSMLDVARLDSQVMNPNMESVNLSLIMRLVHKDYLNDLAARNLTFNLDDSFKDIPPVLADSELLKKAIDQIVVNAIKYTPDGGSITVSSRVVGDSKLGRCAEIQVRDSGIGIDAEHHQIIFEKLYQLGKVELHSSSRTNFKGGGAGLGLAIASGIIRAMNGKIWVESAGHDEEKLPGSTFFVRLQLVKDK